MSNSKAAAQYLEAFDFTKLFLNELGWDGLSHGIPVSVGEQTYELKPVAQKRNVQVLHYAAPAGAPSPDYALRQRMERALTREAREHLIIFTDAAQTSQIWQWVDRKPGQPARYREAKWHKGQSSELLRQKLSAISFDIGEEKSLTVVGVAQRLRGGFDREKLTKRFYGLFKEQRDALEKFVEGIPNAAEDDKRWYTAVLINRLMFIWFLQEKGFLDGDKRYLRNRLEKHEASGAAQSFYLAFLCPLFFRGFATPRTPESEKQIAAEFGKVPYLNGGLFSKHELEERYEGALEVSNAAFDSLFAFFDKWDWHLDDGLRSEAEVKQSGKLGEINPDVLGYIFEKFVNEKENPKGAYYTQEDITDYIGKNTIIPALFQKVRAQQKTALDALAWPLLQQDPDRYIYPAMLKGVDTPYPADIEAGRDAEAPALLERRKPWNGKTPEPWALPTEIWRETIARHDRTREIRVKLTNGGVKELGELITCNLNIRQWAQDVIERCTDLALLREIWATLAGRLPRKHGEKYRHGLSVLDPTCGSGAFLFAALGILKPLYDAALGTMVSLQADAMLSGEKQHPEKWADVNETIDRFFADQTDRQSSYAVNKHIIVNNLYGVDLEEQATEIAKLRLFLKLVALLEPGDVIEPLPDIDFNIRHGNTLVGYATEDETEKAVKGALQGSFDFDNSWEGIKTKLTAAGEAYKNFHLRQNEKGGRVSVEDKTELTSKLKELEGQLNHHLCKAYGKDPSKPKQLQVWKNSHKPFHWYVDFYPMMKSGGFDVVIGNPPFVENRIVKKTYWLVSGQFKSEDAGNLYALCMERCAKSLAKANFAMIVPNGLTGLDDAKSIRDLLKCRFSEKWFSGYSIRPAKLFDGVDQRLCIFIGAVTNRESLCVAGYRHWYADERVALFNVLRYRAISIHPRLDRLPQVSDADGRNVLDRLEIHAQKMVKSYYAKVNSHLIHYHRSPRYWIRAIDFEPHFKSPTKDRSVHHFRDVAVDSPVAASAICAAINSSLFFFWFVTLGNGRNITGRDVEDFPIGDVSKIGGIIAVMNARLMASYRENSFVRIRKDCEFQEFRQSLSKDVMDEIDGLLAKHYGFSDLQLDYIINYDIKYRMGQGAGEADDD
ncbi:MAG: Eco57I restriction-modification methylase domain-containing protein [Polaromonas sp.]|uniref:Eco57I restriction-modification methylase domain-containing protein n=1 Tax=Polaromonas sp. TaxID=1869339 RepID=UPI002734F7CD|nr:Eco57I restriction-modification methylase domain-containing protein [Polaromonas sp.]MDP2819413.1 Eco57I restriction-modification methylase domain-containing protein [Polaromonas sp.]